MEKSPAMSKKIFILEDNDDLRELYVLILEEEDYLITGFATVAEFMQKLAEVPDLYLLDVMLPDGDGIEVCRQLKNDIQTRDVPVIMVSAHKDIDEVTQACPEAMFLSKPFDIEQLAQQIASMVDSAR